eukprot:s217_g13.t1
MDAPTEWCDCPMTCKSSWLPIPKLAWRPPRCPCDVVVSMIPHQPWVWRTCMSTCWSNAYTEEEFTSYYFTVNADFLEGTQIRTCQPATGDPSCLC